MLRPIAAVCCAILAGCLDFDRAHQRCRANGRCGDGGVAGGGAGGDAGGAAGGDAGGTAGGDAGGTAGGTAGGMAGGGAGGGGGGDAGGSAGGAAGGVYDGGTRCIGSARPRLQCGAPWVIADGGVFDHGALRALGDGLVAAYSVGQRVDAVQLSLDGGMRALVSEAASAPVDHISLAAEGDAWAMLYATTTVGQALRCFSGQGDGGTSVGATTTDLSAAVSVVRGAAGSFGWNISDGGCPTVLKTFTSNADSDHVNALHLTGTGSEGFRFTLTGYFNAFNGSVSVAAPLSDGGFDWNGEIRNQSAPYGHDALINTTRTHVQVVFSETEDLATSFHLAVRSLRLDLTSNFPQVTRVFYEPWNWAVTGCGAGCMGIAVTPFLEPRHTFVLFANDDPVISSRSASDAGWDIACETPLAATSVGAAWQGGQLRFLVVEPTKVSLYSCDVPP